MLEFKQGQKINVVEILSLQKIDFNPNEESWIGEKGDKQWFINIMELGNYDKLFDTPEEAKEQMQKMFDFAPHNTYRLCCITTPIKEEKRDEMF